MKCGPICAWFDRKEKWCNRDILEVDHLICFMRHIYIFGPMKENIQESKEIPKVVEKIVEEVNPARNPQTKILDM